MAARKVKSRGSGGLEVHGRTFRARYFKLDPSAPSGFVRVTEGTGIAVDGSDREDCDPLTGDPIPANARKRAELWLETRSAPYRQFIQHGRFVADTEKLAKVALDAKAKTEGKAAEAARALAAAESKLPALTLEAAWVAFDSNLESRQRDPATQRTYDLWYHSFSAWVERQHPEATELRHITTATAREYAKTLLDGDAELKRQPVRGTTYNRHLNALTLIWATLAARDPDGKALYPEARLGGNPFAYDKATKSGIPRIKLERENRPHRRRDLMLEELAKILTTATGEMRVLLALGFYTGLRLGDCATLKFSNVDRVLGTISTRSRKTDTLTATAIHPALARIMEENVKGRSGYLLPEIADLYQQDKFAKELRAETEEELAADYALIQSKKKPVTEQEKTARAAAAARIATRERSNAERVVTRRISGRVELTKRIQAVFQQCGIETSYKEEGETRARPEAGFHSLRHSYATQLERARVALDDRRRLMGHASAKMTEHYTHGETGAALALPDVLDAEAVENASTRAPLALAAVAPTDGERTTGTAAGLYAIVDGMSKAELRKLAKRIDGILKGRATK